MPQALKSDVWRSKLSKLSVAPNVSLVYETTFHLNTCNVKKELQDQCVDSLICCVSDSFMCLLRMRDVKELGHNVGYFGTYILAPHTVYCNMLYVVYVVCK